MSGCERVISRLDALSDGSLPPLEQARDEGHVEACASCAARLEQQRTWLRDLRDHLAPSAAELDFAMHGLEERLSHARRPRRALVAARWRAVAAVAAAGVALVAFQSFGWIEGGVGESLNAFARLDELRLPAVEWPRISDALPPEAR